MRVVLGVSPVTGTADFRLLKPKPIYAVLAFAADTLRAEVVYPLDQAAS